MSGNRVTAWLARGSGGQWAATGCSSCCGDDPDACQCATLSKESIEGPSRLHPLVFELPPPPERMGSPASAQVAEEKP